MAKKYNCEINEKKYFRKTLVIGYRSNGRPIQKQFYGHGEKDADRQMQEYKEKLKNGLNVDIRKMTVEEAMNYWLFTVRLHSNKLKSASFEKDECNYRNYIKGRSIGRIPIQNAISVPFQEYYIELYEKGIKLKNEKTNKITHVSVSSQKIFDLNKTLRVFFNYCISQHFTLNNPCSMKNIEIPGNADGDEDESDEEFDNIQAFTDEETKLIIENLKYKENKDNTFNMAIYLDFLTGLRLGELLGMKKKFLVKYMAKVRNTLKRTKVFDSPSKWHYETKLIRPKYPSSIRNVHFPVSFWSAIEQYLKEQEKKWKTNGLIFNDDCLIFTTDTCKPIDMKNFSRAWERFLKKIGVTYKKPHSIRDTYATTLIRRGASIHDVKDMLGHSSIKITEKYYIFVFPDDKSKVASLLEDIVIC